jgi:hypothetical protein
MTEKEGDKQENDSYNRVLEYYVNESDEEFDLVGIVAYGLYKRQKRDWIIAYKRKYGGSKPSAAETEAVVDSYCTEDQIATLRERAADLLASYAYTFVEASEPEIREKAINQEALRQAREIEQSIKANSGYWRQVGTGLIATAVWTLIVTAVVIAAYFSVRILSIRIWRLKV